MLNRPEYKQLIRRLKHDVEESQARGLVAINKGTYLMWDFARSRHDFDASWPRAMQELGLVDDGTGTHTFTIKGYGFGDRYPNG